MPRIKMHLPLMCTIKGTVILTIWWKVILITVYTTGLVYLHNYVDDITIDFPTKLVTVLGVVFGLLLVFRTNTAYDRYWEGRKLWGTMTYNIRTLTRYIWVMVNETEDSSQEVIEKVSAINLLVAFAYATRNYLRGDYSYEEKDLRRFIAHMPRFSSAKGLQDGESGSPSKEIGKKRESAWRGRTKRWANAKAYETSVPANIPMEISYHIHTYIKSVQQRELIDSSTNGTMNSALNSMVDCLGGFERILRTPIPLAYSVHLHHVTWMYIIALPYQLIGELNWFSIPAVAMASFALFGILAIGWEIENPFGGDENDLPLTDFCQVLHKEILGFIGNSLQNPETWFLSGENHPLLPELGCRLSATDLTKLTKDEVRDILAKGRNIDHSTKTPGNDIGSELKSVSIKRINSTENEPELVPMQNVE